MSEQNPQRPPGGGLGKGHAPGGGGGGGGSTHPDFQVGNILYRWNASLGRYVGSVLGGGSGSTSSSSGGSSGGSSSGGAAGAALTTVTGRKLSQAELDSLKSDYSHIWNLYFGKQLSGAQLVHLAKMDLSSSEFLDRVKVLEKARAYAPFYHQLQNTLRTRGMLRPNENLDVKQFILNKAPAEYYKVVEEAYARSGLVTAGLHIGAPKRGDEYVSHGFLHQLIGTLGRDAVLSNNATVQKLYTDLANNIVEGLPEAHFEGMGTSKRDILTALAGGRGSAEKRKQLEQLMLNKQARGTTEGSLQAPQQGSNSGYTTSVA